MARVRSDPVGAVWPPSSPPSPAQRRGGWGPGSRRPSRHAVRVPTASKRRAGGSDMRVRTMC
eukprot:11857350-Alexandrium_andersonii.AAC.1